MISADVKLDMAGVRYLRGSGANRAMRISLNRAARPVKAAIESAAPADRTGTLKKSIRIRTRYYPRTKTWAAIVGPSKSFKRKGKRITRGPRKGTRPDIRPARFAHLLEFGSVRSRKRLFLAPALARSRGSFTTDLRASLRRELQVMFQNKLWK